MPVPQIGQTFLATNNTTYTINEVYGSGTDDNGNYFTVVSEQYTQDTSHGKRKIAIRWWGNQWKESI